MVNGRFWLGASLFKGAEMVETRPELDNITTYRVEYSRSNVALIRTLALLVRDMEYYYLLRESAFGSTFESRCSHESVPDDDNHEDPIAFVFLIEAVSNTCNNDE